MRHVRLLALLIAEAFPLVLAAEFGPKRLEASRALGVEQRGWSRKFANAQMNRVRRFFRRGVQQELVSSATLEALKALAPLRAGKCNARENPPRGPVAEADFKTTLAPGLGGHAQRGPGAALTACPLGCLRHADPEGADFRACAALRPLY